MRLKTLLGDHPGTTALKNGSVRSDLFEFDLYFVHKFANDFTTGGPVCLFETFDDLRGERFESGEALS